ncbi:MAG: flavodoxin domain-containing protein [Gloeobacteraceae cyanobacterium ES-bin-144]|nr:flavodoxin domain-containing protein [Verrucomicrobiales bacterium]
MKLTLPANAPFTGAQRMWIEGFLDGITSTLAQGTVSGPVATAASGIPVTIAWGSQTGNSESLGKKLAKNLSAKGHSAVVKDMAELTPEDLTSLGHLLIITSTYGDGEPPDNAANLHSALHAEDHPELPSLNFSVLALGDSNYPDFCKCGHDFDQRLAALGAKRLTPIVECDVDFDESFAAWISQIEQALAA